MSTVILVRHGQSITNVRHMMSSDTEDNPLTDLGTSEAATTAKELSRARGISAIFTSTVMRARQTAAIIAKELHLESQVDDRLRERGVGEFNNREFESSEAIDKIHVAEARSGYPHGVESWEHIKNRLQSFFQDAPAGRLIAVTHRDPIAAGLAVMGGKYDDDISFRHILKIPHASMTVVDTDKKKILAIGTSKLPAELG